MRRTLALLCVPALACPATATGAFRDQATTAGNAAAAAATFRPRVATAPVVSGTPRVAETLSSTTGTWERQPASLTRRWERCDGTVCAAVGATGAAYVPVAADVGRGLRVVVTATNAGGSAVAASAQTAVVEAATPPASTSAPSISGRPERGQRLVATAGTWSPATANTALQWRRCSSPVSCTPIGGATGTTYAVTAADLDQMLQVRATATSAGGTATADSALGDRVAPMRAEDASGHGRHAVYAGDTAVVAGASAGGRAVRFAKATDLVTHAAGLPLADRSFTVEAWVRHAHTRDELELVLGQGTQERGKGLHMGYRSGSTFTFDLFDVSLDSWAWFADTQWRHWTGVFDRAAMTFRLYAGGVEVGRGLRTHPYGSPPSPYTGSGPFTVGGAFGGFPFEGDVDDVAIFAAALPEARIRAHAGARAADPAPVLADRPLAFWRFEEPAG